MIFFISDIKSGVPVVDTYKKELDNIFTNLYFKGIGIDSKKSKKRQPFIKQLSFLESFDQCSDNAFGESSMVHEDFL